MRLTGAWQLSSARNDFGGYSALAVTGPGRFLAISDRNTVLRFSLPDHAAPDSESYVPASITDLFPGPPPHVPQDNDCEALAVDPASGEIWAAFEDAAAYWVFSKDLAAPRRVAAPILRDWPGNAGPEAMVRLSDGRFVVLIEAREESATQAAKPAPNRHPAMIYSGAPRRLETPVRFSVALPEGFRPTDATPLPDGRALVLGRDWGITGYRSMIGVLDLAGAKQGATLPVRELARITDWRISDNYEGMAVVPGPDGLTIWLISDNNQSVWLQRTLLLRLEWTGALPL